MRGRLIHQCKRVCISGFAGGAVGGRGSPRNPDGSYLGDELFGWSGGRGRSLWMCMLSKKEGRIEEMLDAVGLEAEKERGILWWLAGWENENCGSC